MAETTYYWDELNDNIFCEEDENGLIAATYETEPNTYGELISQTRDNETSCYHFDGQGTSRALTDENQNIVETATYSAFGEVVEKTSTITNPFGYIGALGYYVNPGVSGIDVRERVYSPMLARWLSTDPLVFLGGDENLYRYAGNNPINFADPSGLKCCVCRWRRQTARENVRKLDSFFQGSQQPYLTNISNVALQGPNPILRALGFQQSVPVPTHWSGAYNFLNKAGDTAVAAHAFFISADVCETRAGDCLADFNEFDKWYAVSTNGGPYVLQVDDLSGHPVPSQGPQYVDRTPTQAPAVGRQPYIGDLIEGHEDHPHCTKRIVWADFPTTYGFIGHRRFGTKATAIGAKQTYKIHDKSNPNAPPAVMRFKFSLWMAKASPMAGKFIPAGSSTIPNRPECNTCC